MRMFPPTPKLLQGEVREHRGSLSRLRAKSRPAGERKTRNEDRTYMREDMKQRALKFEGPAKIRPKMEEMTQVRLKHHGLPMMSTERPLRVR